jgi:hypothetical protein
VEELEVVWVWIRTRLESYLFVSVPSIGNCFMKFPSGVSSGWDRFRNSETDSYIVSVPTFVGSASCIIYLVSRRRHYYSMNNSDSHRLEGLLFGANNGEPQTCTNNCFITEKVFFFFTDRLYNSHIYKYCTSIRLNVLSREDVWSTPLKGFR